jgi:hypothetical protein
MSGWDADRYQRQGLRRGGEWFADYWRLRLMAVADPAATGPGVEYPPGRRRGRSELLR